MFFVAALAAAIATVPLFGGRIRALADIDLKWGWALFAAIGIQIVIISVLPKADGPDRVAHVVSYALAGAFLIANMRIPGLWIICLGAAMNVSVIVANGGVMYGSPAAFRSVGVHITDAHFSNSVSLAHPKLAFLGDLWAIPAGIPFATTLSVGDVVIAAGAFVLVHGICGSRLFPRWLHVPFTSPQPAPAS